MSLAASTLAFLAALGNASACIYLNNRVHATGLPRRVVQAISLYLHGSTVFGSCLIFCWTAFQAPPFWPPFFHASAEWIWQLGLAWCYLAFCLFVAMVLLPWSLWRRRNVRPPTALLSNSSTFFNWRRELGSQRARRRWDRFITTLPGNEMLHLEVNEKTLRLPRLDPQLDGLTIAHLTDLHFTGVVSRRYFENAVERVNAMNPDLVAVTGDLIDRSACMDWIPETLGRLRSRYGVFFVLGNHDLRVDSQRLRRLLKECGLVDLGGCSQQLRIAGCLVVLAGNELPWFKPAADMRDCPGAVDGRRTLRILLSHSPDQIRWAKARDFDLLLAGHNHGGQIRLPFIGPIVSPSYYGVKYASGVFYEPPTLMHVSRGVSCKTPIRFRCPPEVTKLALVSHEPCR